MRGVFAVALFSTGLVVGGPKLYLKTRMIDPTEVSQQVRGEKARPPQAERFGRQRLLIQYSHAPGQEDLQLLNELGIETLGYVHENGLVVACDVCAPLANLDLLWTAPFEAADKISPMLTRISPGEMRAVVVELHPDVDLNEGRRLMIDEGADLGDNPDLTSRHILVRIDVAQLWAIARRDEVAYIFPAMAALNEGAPVVACAGAWMATGLIAGQYTAKVGDGWDGPGLGPAVLGYFIENTGSQLPADQVVSEFHRALAEWSKVVRITFTPAARPTSLRTINVLFASRGHDDPYPFDGPGGVLAHTFYPAPPNPEPLAGDLHFDEDETWRIGARTDVFSVALHELGHALGLGHSDQPGAVMYPYYSLHEGLTKEDVVSIQELYAARVTSEPPVAKPPDPPVSQPEPAEPPSSPPPPAPALVLNVQPPPGAVLSESILLLGSVVGTQGAVTLTWNTDRGHSGMLSSGPSWSAQIPLELGSNQITLTASNGGRSAKAGVSVERRAAATVPPNIQVSYPAASSSFAVTQANFALRGTAVHPSGIARVTWTNHRGGSGVALGTSPWDSGPITLSTGGNTITMTAIANDGAIGTRVVQVEYATTSNPVRDTTAPAVTITGAATLTTSAEWIVLSGTAKDNTSVAEVVWFSSTGPAGKAEGTTTWTTPKIPLTRGYNSIVVRAFDAAGNMGWRSVGVTRQ
jgi:hypothetical protein